MKQPDRTSTKGCRLATIFPEASLIAQLKKLEQQLLFLNSDALAPAVLMRSELQTVENLKSLKVEFARLVCRSIPVCRRRLMDPSILKVSEKSWEIRPSMSSKRYVTTVLTISEYFKDVPDHIAAELEFMYFLVFNEIRCDTFRSIE